MELMQEPIAPTASPADELYAKAMLLVIRRSRDILKGYVKELPDIAGKMHLHFDLQPTVDALEEAADAIASAIDEASCEDGCPCVLRPYHGALKAGI